MNSYDQQTMDTSASIIDKHMYNLINNACGRGHVNQEEAQALLNMWQQETANCTVLVLNVLSKNGITHPSETHFVNAIRQVLLPEMLNTLRASRRSAFGGTGVNLGGTVQLNTPSNNLFQGTSFTGNGSSVSGGMFGGSTVQVSSMNMGTSLPIADAVTVQAKTVEINNEPYKAPVISTCRNAVLKVEIDDQFTVQSALYDTHKGKTVNYVNVSCALPQLLNVTEIASKLRNLNAFKRGDLNFTVFRHYKTYELPVSQVDFKQFVAVVLEKIGTTAYEKDPYRELRIVIDALADGQRRLSDAVEQFIVSDINTQLLSGCLLTNAQFSSGWKAKIRSLKDLVNTIDPDTEDPDIQEFQKNPYFTAVMKMIIGRTITQFISGVSLDISSRKGCEFLDHYLPHFDEKGEEIAPPLFKLWLLKQHEQGDAKADATRAYEGWMREYESKHTILFMPCNTIVTNLWLDDFGVEFDEDTGDMKRMFLEGAKDTDLKFFLGTRLVFDFSDDPVAKANRNYTREYRLMLNDGHNALNAIIGISADDKPRFMLTSTKDIDKIWEE